ncbi:MAG: hypothetical protein HBSAPP03_18200 [Phycisphaerae bacterium]|nr:MAG: hypothetical protein HBSAPP03_18200 [Phycisphaerae bacterium]
MSDGVSDPRVLAQHIGPFPPQAVEFIRLGLAHTVKMVHGEHAGAEDESRHINGRQLCIGLRDFAIRQYGRLAKTVLRSWNITCTEDFGRIVFAMVQAEMMRTSKDDSIDDFRGVYDFDEAFADLSHSR